MAKCDFCKEEASYDGKTVFGPWAYMCYEHFIQHGMSIYTKLQKQAEIKKTDSSK